tara:strand:+ start:17871 stop:19547 length:1677 start_codon:yes stop_codon:yes gene_type:complete
MKLFNSKKFILFLIICACLRVFFSCAAIQSPSGGAKDNTPPFLLYSKPESGTTGFTGGQVELFFSEYLQEKSIFNSINILPKMKNPPEIKYKGDKVYIKFPDSLLNNQTYIISINRELQDEHGVPIAQGMQLAFSTGEKIDRSEISGKIIYEGDASVLLWKIRDSTDHINFFERFSDYNIDAADNGEFVFKYLSKGIYKIAGVDISMSTSILDPGYSVYGLPWVNQIEIDTLNSHESDINIMISKKTRLSRLLSAEWVSNRWGRLTFDNPINEYKSILPIDIISDSVGVRVATFIDNIKDNILNFVIADSLRKNIKTTVKISPVYQNSYMVIDSANIYARTPRAEDTTFLHITNLNKKTTLEIEKNQIIPLDIYFSKIIDKSSGLDSSITLTIDSTLLDININMVSPIHFQVIPINNWEPLSNYSLNIIRDKIILENGRSIKDSIQTIVISTTKFKKFGSLTGSIAKSDFNPIIARLISYENGNLFYDVLVNSESSFKINNLPEGEYNLLFFYDKDANAKYSLGHLMPYSTSEWFEVFTDTISIRNNWDMEVSKIEFQ